MPRTSTFLAALAAALAVAVPVAAAEGQPTGPHSWPRVRAEPTGWYTALVARSEALNRKNGLDGGTGKALAAPRHTDAGLLGLRKDESG